MRHVESPPSNQIVFNSDTLWFESGNPIVDLLKESGGSMPKKAFIEEYGKPQSTGYKHLQKAIKAGEVKDDDGIIKLLQDE